jgi:hypothetical protein
MEDGLVLEIRIPGHPVYQTSLPLVFVLGVPAVYGISEGVADTSCNLAAREGRYYFVQKINESALKATRVILERAH